MAALYRQQEPKEAAQELQLSINRFVVLSHLSSDKDETKDIKQDNKKEKASGKEEKNESKQENKKENLKGRSKDEPEPEGASHRVSRR